MDPMNETPGTKPAPPATPISRRWLKISLPILVMVVAVGAFATRDIWRWYFVSDNVTYEAPDAPALTPSSDDQTVYRIDPTRSSASYSVQEHLAGITRTAVGTTNALAGDILIDGADPTKSTVGTIVINVELLRSDNSLRDKRIRHDFLKSSTYKFVKFIPTDIIGLPNSLVDRQLYDVTIVGDLLVKTTTAPATFKGTASIHDGELTAAMTANVKSSTYDIGPITISGLVSTGDDIALSLDLVAVDIANGAPPEPGTSLANDVAYDPDAPGDFAATVMPILASNCASCHNAGGVGASTWALDTAGDAGEVADGIAVVTGSAYMPPWPASDLGVPLHEPWKLSQSEVDALSVWAGSGGTIDVPADTPIVAPTSSIKDIERDVIATAARPYAGSADRKDDYRCQVFDPNLTEAVWVVGLQFIPDQVTVVHHSVDYRATASLRTLAEAADSRDPRPGWTCFGLTGLGDGDAQPEQIMAWAPGQQPEAMAEGTGLLFQPGDFVIAQIHYHYEDDFPADQSQLVFDVADPVALAAASGSLVPITNHVIVAPAEIPCLPGESGPMCDRDNVLARLEREFGDGNGPDSILQACNQRLEDVAVLVDGVARGSCDLPIGGSVELLSIFGHMHEYGESFRMTLNPGKADERILLDIPNWSFDWQFNYRLEQPVTLERGDTVRIECTWNRARVQRPEPAYVTWSDGTADEMCYSVATTRPPS